MSFLSLLFLTMYLLYSHLLLLSICTINSLFIFALFKFYNLWQLLCATFVFSLRNKQIFTIKVFIQNTLCHKMHYFFIYILSILVYNKPHHYYSMNQYDKIHIDSGEEFFYKCSILKGHKLFLS